MHENDISRTRLNNPFLYFIALTILAALGNFLNFPIYFGADYVFGSIFILILSATRGPWTGTLSAIIAQSYIIYLWKQPYAYLVFVLEALVVGMLVKTKKFNVFFADFIFWFFAAPLLVLPVHYYLIDIDLTQALMISLKQPVNGLFNAMFANLIIIGMVFIGKFAHKDSQVSLRELLLILIISFVVITTFTISVLNTRQIYSSNQQKALGELKSLVGHVRFELQLFRNRGNSFLREFYRNYKNTQSTLTIPDLNQFEIAIISPKESNSFRIMAAKKKSKHYPQLKTIQFIQRSEQTLFSNFDDSGMFAQKLKLKNGISLIGIGKKEYLNNFLTTQNFRSQAHIVIFDKEDHIVAKNRTAVFTATDIEAIKGCQGNNEFRAINLFPSQKDIPELVRWKKTYLASKIAIFPECYWYAAAKISYAPYINQLYEYYITEFSVLLLVILFALPLTFYVRNVLSRSMNELAVATANLPLKLQNRQEIIWKKIRILELDQLSSNFQKVANIIRSIFEEQEKEYLSIFDKTDDALLVLDPANYTIVDANVHSESLFQKKKEDFLYKNIDILFPSDREVFIELSQIAHEKGLVDKRITLGIKENSKGIHTVIVNAIAVQMRNKPLSFFILKDITEQLIYEKNLFLSDQVFENTEEGIIITNANEEIIRVNQSFSRITGFDAQEVIGKHPNILKSHWHQTEFYQEMKSQYQSTGSWRGEIWNRRKNGDIYVEWLSINAVYNKQKKITNYIGVFIDITEQKRAQERINKLAYYDILTDLPNRINFKDRLEHTISRYRRNGKKFSLFFIDLDNFKTINDTLGHHAGDKLIQEIASRIQKNVRENDSLARLGGDEFTLITEDVNDMQSVSIIAMKILDTIKQSMKIEGNEVFVTGSIGICTFPEDGDNIEEMMRNADTAMYRAKAAGKNAYEFFRHEMKQAALHKMELESRMRQALKNQEFELYYQPQVCLQSGEIHGLEALLRWKSSSGQIISPNEFIPIAEETGIIGDISTWVIGQSCRDLQQMSANGFSVKKMSINIANFQFKQKDFADSIYAQINKENGIEPASFELELTEHIIMENIYETQEILSTLKNMGFSLAIDDFGTGNSSLSHLKRFQIDTLKIDKSFVFDTPEDQQSKEIVLAIISMAKALNMNVIAEGVESEQQLKFLQMNQCDQFQGYYFSRPIPMKDLLQFLSQKKLKK